MKLNVYTAPGRVVLETEGRICAFAEARCAARYAGRFVIPDRSMDEIFESLDREIFATASRRDVRRSVKRLVKSLGGRPEPIRQRLQRWFSYVTSWEDTDW
jgi:hypothetical protein